MLIYPKSLAGVTLIELMIAIAIIGILLVAGLPEASNWIQNTKIRTASESISNGLQFARGEAVRRNTWIQFMLTNSTPNAATLPALAAGNAGNLNGVNWVVMNYQPTGVYTPPDFIQGAAESSTNVAINSDAAKIVFNSLGRACNDVGVCLAATGANIKITNPTGGACVAAGPMRCLKVEVQSGGQIKMCDPAVAAGDNRACVQPALP